jgi:translocation and assembly module TamB
MRRAVKMAVRAAAALIALPLALAALVLVGGNTAPGRPIVARLVGIVSGGELKVFGLSGRFPDRLRAARMDIRDRQGVWARIADLRIDWSPLALLHGTVRIDRLRAARVAVLRRPVLAGGATALPMPVAIAALRVDRLDLAAPVAGAPAALGLAGHLRLVTFERGRIALAARRLDRPGYYRLAGAFAPTALALDLAVAEPERGLVAALAGLPDLGALGIIARLDGPPAAVRTRLTIAAGPLTARAAGTIDLVHDRAALDLSGAAPAMTPRPGLSWRSAALTARLRGRLMRPRASGHLAIDGLVAAGVAIDRVRADLAGDAGRLGVTALISGLRLPGPYHDLFAAAPVALHAEARLDRPRRPVGFAVSHPLFVLAGRVDGAAPFAGSATATLPTLMPLFAPTGIDVRGRAAATAWFSAANGETRLSASGGARLTGGRSQALALLGDRPGFGLAFTKKGDRLVLDRAVLDGKGLRLSAAGSDRAGLLDVGWKLRLADLSALLPRLAGRLAAAGRVSGPQRNLTVTADLDGALGRAGAALFPVTARLAATLGSPREQRSRGAGGLPAAPQAQITANAKLAGATARLTADLQRRDDGTLGLTIADATWKSAELTGRLAVPPGTTVPQGRVRFTLARLADLAPLIGMRLAGRAAGTLDLGAARGVPLRGPRTISDRAGLEAHLALTAGKLGLAGGVADRLTLDGTIGGPWQRPDLSLRLALDGVAMAGVAGTARLTANGPVNAAAWRLATALHTRAGTAVPLTAAGTWRVAPGEVRLASLKAGYGGMLWRLLAPARIDLAGGVAVDGLRLGSGGAVLAATGRLTPKLALDLSLRNAGPVLARALLPGQGVAGDVALTAALRGKIGAPKGIVRLTGRRLRFEGGVVPAASLDMTARLVPGAARLDADLAAGPAIRLRLAGTAPLSAGGALALEATGGLDLAFLDPLLTANGRTLRGRLTVAAAIAGTPMAPRLSGTVRLAGGAFQDFTQGVHLTDIDGLAEAAGATVRLRRLSARAGAGTVSAAGTATLAPGLPVALTLAARHAQALAGNLISAETDADLTLRGQATGRLDLAGRIALDKADITIPDQLPQDVPVLEIRRPGRQPRSAAASNISIGFDLDLAAPGGIRMQGRGLDAELGGRLHIAGSAAAPQIRGGFSLRHGAIDLAGQTLNFTTGRIGFDGRSLGGRIDPLLDFVAQSSANGVTATLQVTGYADAPKIALSSAPPLPQDEILALLLFGQNVKQLSPFQIAQIGQSLAALSGMSGIDPLLRVRRQLGLDRLSVGGGAGTGGAALEAGKYVTNRVYLGARQAISGGTQAQLRVDLTKHLKLDATLGTGRTAPAATTITPSNDPGSSLGLTYQLEY